MSVKGADPEAVKILAEYDVFEPAEYNKIKCNLTGHELPNRGKSLKEYTATKKFQTAWKVHEIMKNNPGVFEELDKNLLGCKITKKVLARDPVDLEKHLSGKKFKRAIAKGVTGDEEDEEEQVEMASDVDDEDVGDEAFDEQDEEIEEEDEEEEAEEEEMEVDEEPVKPKKAGKAMKKNENAGSNTKPSDEDSYNFGVIPQEKSKAQKRKTEGKGVTAMKKKKRSS